MEIKKEWTDTESGSRDYIFIQCPLCGKTMNYPILDDRINPPGVYDLANHLLEEHTKELKVRRVRRYTKTMVRDEILEDNA